MKALTSAQLAQYLAVTQRTVQRKAINEGWVYQEQYGLGGIRKLYPYAALPQQIKNKIVARIIVSHDSLCKHDSLSDDKTLSIAETEENLFAAITHNKPYEWLHQYCMSHKADKAKLNRHYIKLGILGIARAYIDEVGKGKIKGLDAFCPQYPNLGLDELVYQVVPQLSRISLLRWEKNEVQWLAHNAEVISNARRKVVLDKLISRVALEVVMVTPGISARRLHQHLKTFVSSRKTPSLAQLKTWLAQQKA